MNPINLSDLPSIEVPPTGLCQLKRDTPTERYDIDTNPTVTPTQ